MTAPNPTSIVACPLCAADCSRDRTDGHRHACTACDWRDDLCGTCGAIMRWDPVVTGTTCGGLRVRGALVCCEHVEVSKRSKPADDAWRIAKSGVSLDAGGARIRVDGRDVDTAALVARIAKLPELEVEVEELRAALARRVK